MSQILVREWHRPEITHKKCIVLKHLTFPCVIRDREGGKKFAWTTLIEDLPPQQYIFATTPSIMLHKDVLAPTDEFFPPLKKVREFGAKRVPVDKNFMDYNYSSFESLLNKPVWEIADETSLQAWRRPREGEGRGYRKVCDDEDKAMLRQFLESVKDSSGFRPGVDKVHLGHVMEHLEGSDPTYHPMDGAAEFLQCIAGKTTPPRLPHDNYELDRLIDECCERKSLYLMGSANHWSPFTREDNPYEPLNVSNPLHGLVPPVSGVSTLQCWVAMPYAITPFHYEDANLDSISFHCYGAPKIWILVKEPESKANLKKLMDKVMDYRTEEGERIDCPAIVNARDAIFYTEILVEAGVNFEILVQFPGDYVFLNRDIAHMVINLGFNISLAGNSIFPNFVERLGNPARISPICTCEIEPPLDGIFELRTHGMSSAVFESLPAFAKFALQKVQRKEALTAAMEEFQDTFPCEFEGCPRKYKTRRLMLRHLNKAHSVFTCNRCQKHLATRKGLFWHKVRVHKIRTDEDFAIM